MRASIPLGGGGSRERNMSGIGITRCLQNVVLSSNENKAYPELFHGLVRHGPSLANCLSLRFVDE